MSVARRPLLTATAAGSLLCALWFVPSANATDGKPPSAPARSTAAAPGTQADLALADTGTVDTSPYLFGGTLFLGVGAGFVAFSVRRARQRY
ncbi:MULTISPECIES: hypothetical protein [unclassified Streptomyces]|uniref:LPXTG cell wall anchor domain-containing protein n=1 Tax=Streptomyces sp. NBC_00060 TaxID=2975636 RepID=A0AAU2H0J8_9ACTN